MTARTRGRTTWAAAAAIVAAAALTATGCGGDGDGGGGESSDALKVGLITDAGQLNDKGFNELAYAGLKRSIRELGVEGRVVESKSSADYVPNMAALVRQGYGLIFGIGFAQG